MPPENLQERENRVRVMVLRSIITGLTAGCTGIILYALQAPSWFQFFSIIGVACLIAVAAFFSGGLLGFLFGVPHAQDASSQSSTKPHDTGAATRNAAGSTQNQPVDTTPDSVSQPSTRKSSEQSKVSYHGNTNLEQISDWLCKILVGAGLTQITTFPPVLKRYALFFAPGLGNFSNSQVFSMGLLIFFTVSGFLVGYLWTRLHLGQALVAADIDALGDQIDRVVGKMRDFEKQTEIDRRAWSAAQHQLNPVTETLQLSQEDLNAAIQAASTQMRSRIFFLARAARSDAGKPNDAKPALERIIPIFRALIAADVKSVYHANHAELAFALKDLRVPQWREAETELTKAIDIRERETLGAKVYLIYEYNRALCRINQDAGGYGAGNASDEKTRQNILADLKAAALEGGVAELIVHDPVVKNWSAYNTMDLADICAGSASQIQMRSGRT
jgi:hypothetical protein